MRKSTLIMMGIMLAACFGMLFLANAYLSPFKEDIEAARTLTQYLEDRGDIVPGSKAKLRRVTNDPQRKGLGLLLEVQPSAELLKRPRGLTTLVRRSVEQAVANYPLEGAGSVAWLRATLTFPDGVVRSCEVLRLEAGGYGEPTPRLPDVWPPPAPPDARTGPDPEPSAAPAAPPTEPSTEPTAPR
jgi:hypothetical protein